MVRSGVDGTCPEGCGWQHIPTPPERDVTTVGIGRSGRVWSVTWDGTILVRTGVTRDAPTGLLLLDSFLYFTLCYPCPWPGLSLCHCPWLSFLSFPLHRLPYLDLPGIQYFSNLPFMYFCLFCFCFSCLINSWFSGVDWIVVEPPNGSPLQQVAVGMKSVWALTRDHKVWFRRGLQASKEGSSEHNRSGNGTSQSKTDTGTTGSSWLKMVGMLNMISVGPNDQVRKQVFISMVIRYLFIGHYGFWRNYNIHVILSGLN